MTSGNQITKYFIISYKIIEDFLISNNRGLVFILPVSFSLKHPRIINHYPRFPSLVFCPFSQSTSSNKTIFWDPLSIYQKLTNILQNSLCNRSSIYIILPFSYKLQEEIVPDSSSPITFHPRITIIKLVLFVLTSTLFSNVKEKLQIMLRNIDVIFVTIKEIIGH